MSETKVPGLNVRITSKNQLDNIKKVAITKPGQQALFLELDQNRPLAGIIQDICEKWGIMHPEEFAIQFSDSNKQQIYITERNRLDISNGDVLVLTSSPSKTAKEIYETMKDGKPEDKLLAMDKLSTLARDITFSMEFITNEGQELIKNFVQEGKFHGDPMACLLRSFMALMDHNLVSWNTIEPEFTKKVANYIASPKHGVKIIQPSLEILESVILNNTELSKHKEVEHHVTPEKIVVHLQASSALQKNALALLNALFLKAPPEKKKKINASIQSRSFRNVIVTVSLEAWNKDWNAANKANQSVLNASQTVGSEMGHQLYCLQTLMLNMHEARMNTPADAEDPNVLKQIEALAKICFEMDGDTNQAANRKSNLYRKLGFMDQSHPAVDFAVHTPPGMLALDNIAYFSNKYQENCVKVVLENCTRADEHDCPFIKASIMLTKALCEILRIGEPPQDEETSYYPMFFSHDKPFEEFFCICIQLLNKTWREMRASTEDFPKVLGVAKEQITRALQIQPPTFDAFRVRVNQLTYAEIIKLWERDRKNKEEDQAQAAPIVELRKMLTPEMKELIRQQRLNYLTEGSKFPKYTTRGRAKEKYWQWKLTPNMKTFHYGDCAENDNLSLEQLGNKLSVTDIKGFVTGRDCPHVKDKKDKAKTTDHHLFWKSTDHAFSMTNFSFAIQPVNSEPTDMLCFVAKDDVEFDMWTDGLNVLLGHEMTSPQMKKDLNMLLDMEIRIRLLDAEGIAIPNEPPPIPPEPDNYDFAFNDM
ncbi:engulfment and cell motility protein 1-like isoform X3 [Ostrea edulis]|uniref:engulfment and cell motility protein 1-like isoform X3 n=1 Tax=Ostrea edulis TaxID=37623 RepID=UPI002094BB89|nr:engulfment and cell motility protein 1-like isoform X3 [Ostrea edulis]